MMNEKFEKIKSLIIKKTEKNNKKSIENLVFFVVILIITIIAINIIWKEDKDKKIKNEKNISNISTIANNINENINETNISENNIEEKIESILSQIDGVGKVKVLITYSSTSMIIPLYNEDSEESLTEENDKEGGTRKITENKRKKDIIYQETTGEKKPITQSIISPKVEGAIVTAVGAENADIKAKIIQAVEAVTGLSTHKIQVFEMKK